MMYYLAAFWAWFRRWLPQRRKAIAQGLTEYALILFLIAVVVFGILSTVGRVNQERFDNIQCQVNEAGTGDPANCP